MVKNILEAANHFVFNRNAIDNLKNQFILQKTLKPFVSSNLIDSRTSFIYIFSYLSGAFKTEDKFQILTDHYSSLQHLFEPDKLEQLFTKGIECYQDFDDENKYSVELCSSSTLEFEGSLSLFLKVNNLVISTLSFSIAPGKLFNLKDENVFYIARLQRSDQASAIVTATKHFKDVNPARILMRSLEALASAFSITTCVGVSSANQLTAIEQSECDSFYFIYDKFWMENGGVLNNGNYIIPLPVPQKSILSVKQSHRNRTLKKREKLQEIYNSVQKNVRLCLAVPLNSQAQLRNFNSSYSSVSYMMPAQ